MLDTFPPTVEGTRCFPRALLADCNSRLAGQGDLNSLRLSVPALIQHPTVLQDVLVQAPDRSDVTAKRGDHLCFPAHAPPLCHSMRFAQDRPSAELPERTCEWNQLRRCLQYLEQ